MEKFIRTLPALALATIMGCTEPADVHVDAREAFDQGLALYWEGGEANLAEAIEQFDRSVQLDSTFVEGYAGLSRGYTSIGDNYNSMDPEESHPRARAAAERALALDSTLAEAHLAMAMVKAGQDWDWDGADAAFRRALELEPKSMGSLVEYSFLLMSTGREDEAGVILGLASEAHEDTPAVAWANNWLKFRTGDTETLKEALAEAIVSDPDDPGPHWMLALAYGSEGAYDEAAEQLEIQIPLMDGPEVDEVALLGHMHARAGRTVEATAMLQRLDEMATEGNYVSPVLKAWIYAGLGDSDQAMEWLERGFETRAHRAGYDLKFFEFVFEPISSDPRFATLLERTGL